MDPARTYDLLRDELGSYSPVLAAKPHVVVLSKADLWPADLPPLSFDAPEAQAVVTISSVAQQGLVDLKETLWSSVNAADESRDTQVPLP
jgi:GTP-binding protein